jgi:uncharacterized protein (TIGR02301 family)
MSPRVRRLGLALALCAVAAGQTCAQTAPAKPAAPPPPVEPPPAAEPPPPYEPQLLRLAELMGALAYLRDLCGAHDADAYRAKMASLLEIEAKSETRKESLAGAYNSGFRGYRLSYRVCTPAANEIIARFLDEAARISTDVANRYGG